MHSSEGTSRWRKELVMKRGREGQRERSAGAEEGRDTRAVRASGQTQGSRAQQLLTVFN